MAKGSAQQGKHATEAGLDALARDVCKTCIQTLGERFANNSLTFGHWAVLKALLTPRPITLAEIARRIGLSAAATSKMLGDLKQLGYVAFVRTPKKMIRLTPRGRAVTEALAPVTAKRSRSGPEVEDDTAARMTIIRIVDGLARRDLSQRHRHATNRRPALRLAS